MIGAAYRSRTAKAGHPLCPLFLDYGHLEYSRSSNNLTYLFTSTLRSINKSYYAVGFPTKSTRQCDHRCQVTRRIVFSRLPISILWSFSVTARKWVQGFALTIVAEWTSLQKVSTVRLNFAIYLQYNGRWQTFLSLKTHHIEVSEAHHFMPVRYLLFWQRWFDFKDLLAKAARYGLQRHLLDT